MTGERKTVLRDDSGFGVGNSVDGGTMNHLGSGEKPYYLIESIRN